MNRDSMYLRMYEYKDKGQKAVMYFYPEVPVHSFYIPSIEDVITENKKLENSMKAFALTSLVTGIIVSPIVSYSNGKMDWTRVKTISGISAGGLCLSLIISFNFWDSHHRLRPKHQKKSVWTIRQ